jgi:hypothetical protein
VHEKRLRFGLSYHLGTIIITSNECSTYYYSYKERSNKVSNVEELEVLKQQLNRLINSEEVVLYEGEALQLSQELDKLIVDYHEDKEDIDGSSSVKAYFMFEIN